ncbi:hypothetical protein U9M48_024475 [Paspalum notatum var. saurae]|uniref:GAG-pre-integrase domain-containing protein n=1 Tax=Paspalum notatum var. saurae TaxID=547442 RepID=A0AAQ3TN73_PASNO
MTGHRKWFSSLNPVSTKEYITFGDNGQGREVRFKKGACRVLDAEETLVCSLLPFGQVLRVDLTSVSGPARCLVASPSADIWKWHRRLGHLSFEMLVRMVTASHTPVSQVMTSYLEAKQVVETCEVSFDETMPCTTPAYEISGDDEGGTPIFEDEEGADDVGVAGATAPAAAPAPSTTSSDDEGGPLPTASSSLPR